VKYWPEVTNTYLYSCHEKLIFTYGLIKILNIKFYIRLSKSNWIERNKNCNLSWFMSHGKIYYRQGPQRFQTQLFIIQSHSVLVYRLEQKCFIKERREKTVVGADFWQNIYVPEGTIHWLIVKKGIHCNKLEARMPISSRKILRPLGKIPTLTDRRPSRCQFLFFLSKPY